MKKNVSISCTGCCLADYLYADIDFGRKEIQQYLSRQNGDGGITPGKLIFTESLEAFTSENIDQICSVITEDVEPDTFNLGGPAIVALAGAAQLLNDTNVSCRFYGVVGNDKTGEKLCRLIEKLPVNIDNYQTREGATPNTVVFSDPRLNNGKGERAFVNNIGVAQHYLPEHLSNEFFEADVLIYGATALVPQLHNNLTSLLRKGRQLGKLNIVTTVFDFMNEKANPDKRWPLGESDDSYKLLDLLVVDYEEAIRMSNASDLDSAIEFFKNKGVAAMVITHGCNPVTFFSNGALFESVDIAKRPICHAIDRELDCHPEIKGDTTGCGDNFAGGIIYSMISQLKNTETGSLDLANAVAWGAVAGGFTRSYIGGTFFEEFAGEKMIKIKPFYDAYIEELN